VFEKPPSPPIASNLVEIAYAPRAQPNAADHEIVRLVAAAPEPGAIRVVTSDRWLADQVKAAGATVEPAKAFRERLETL
jgi:predicted RNA-binding protein with PIN domain